MGPANSKADRCCRRLSWDEIDPAYIRALVDLARAEDLEGKGLRIPPERPGDPTGELLPLAARLEARVVPREPVVVCGQGLAAALARRYDPALRYEILVSDGLAAETGQAIARLGGPQRSVLAAERPLLNFLQRLSGIATLASKFARALQGSPTRLLDTRKTTPGYRVLEKYAFAQGGGWNHRLGLFDRVMLKDNHLAAFGGRPGPAAREAVAQLRAQRPDLLVEMEVDRLEQIPLALEAGVDVVLLDNFAPDALAKAVAQIGGAAATEASGGIGLEDLPRLADLGLDFVSTGAPVHQSRWADIGLDA